jgi:hypothetical protein
MTDKPKEKPNGHVPQKPLKTPTGPSKKTRDEYIRKVKEIVKKKK